MSTAARVDSIDAIKEFRVYMTKFQELATMALGDADSDIQRIQSWLEGEQQTYWTGQIRKRQEIVSRAEEAFRQKRINFHRGLPGCPFFSRPSLKCFGGSVVAERPIRTLIQQF